MLCVEVTDQVVWGWVYVIACSESRADELLYHFNVLHLALWHFDLI